MTEPRFLPGATKDYEDACTWYYARSERAAERFEEAVERALDGIVEAPERWPFCDRRHRQHLLRKCPYSIVYRRSNCSASNKGCKWRSYFRQRPTEPVYIGLRTSRTLAVFTQRGFS